MSRKRKKSKAPAVILAALLVIAAGAVLYFAGGRLRSRVFYPLKYREEIVSSAEKYGLSPCLVAAVINTESGFRPEAVSVDGAKGLMQLLPSTAEWIAAMRGMDFEEQQLFEPDKNIDYGCWLLKYLIDRYDGSVRYALIAYNAGHGRLEGWLANEEYVDENGELAVIPYGETDSYVKKAERAMEEYRERYGEQLEKADKD